MKPVCRNAGYQSTHLPETMKVGRIYSLGRRQSQCQTKTMFMDKMTKKIFVVDDDEMLSMALEDFLERKTGAEIRLFPTGEDCLQHLGELPDFIILDYNLNSVKKDAADGIAILEEIKRINDQVKVVMLSSQDATWIVLQTKRMGAAEYVIKDEQAFEKILSFLETTAS